MLHETAADPALEIDDKKQKLKVKYAQIQIDFTVAPDDAASSKEENKELSRKEKLIKVGFWLMDVMGLKRQDEGAADKEQKGPAMDLLQFKVLMARADLVKAFKFNDNKEDPEKSLIDKDALLTFFEEVKAQVKQVSQAVQEATTLQAIDDLWTKH